MAYLVTARLNDSRITQANSEIEVKKGDKVIIDIDGVLEFGEVSFCESENQTEETNRLVRVATSDDIDTNESYKKLQPQDRQSVLRLVQKNGLSLKLVSVLRSFDNKKLLVMYTAETRVDFRQLVRDLASEFRMRIEMRQINEREEAFFLGGCGACGQPICCRRFLNNPKQTTIKMAKIQCSALNPNRINGLCGKLMCCLQYEFEQYQEILDTMPAINSRVLTADGEGKVEYNDCLRELVAVRLDGDGGVKKFPLAEVTFVDKKGHNDE